MALTAGSIAFLGYDADGTQRFAIVAVDELPAGTVIYFTDRAWNGTSFAQTNSEGTLTWTVPAGGIASGTVLSFDTVGSNSLTLSAEKAGVSVAGGTVSRSGNGFDTETSNEVLYAYLGTNANTPTTFLGAVANDGFTNSNGSLANTGLTAGTTAVDLGAVDADADFGVYKPAVGGSSFDSRDAMLAAVNNPANWTVLDTGADDSSAFVPFLTNSNSPIENVNFVIDTVAPDAPVFVPGDDHLDLVLNAAEAGDGETFTFTAEAGSTVKMTFTGTEGQLGPLTATVASPGVYTVTLTQGQLASLGEGEFTISAVAFDGVGNASGPGTGTVELDTTAPDAPVLVPGDDHDDGTIALGEIDDGETFTFTAEPGSTVSVSFSGEDGSVGPLTATEDPGNPGTFTVDLTKEQLEELGEGPLTVSATATDAAGNVSDPSSDEIDVIPCFLTGTRIATPSGEVAVEALQPGDLVLTADGRAVPVRFVGRRAVMPRFAGAEAANPIRIAAGALAENVPARDLFVSPNHGIVVDGVLAFASALVNGTTIAQVAGPGPRFTYHSIETEGHEAILAENCPAETFMDHVPRAAWDNHADYLALHPAEPRIAEMDLPHAKSHRQVPAEIHAMIAERAAALAPPVATAA